MRVKMINSSFEPRLKSGNRFNFEAAQRNNEEALGHALVE
jgi:hypothetical protein